MDHHLRGKEIRVTESINLRDTSRLWALIISSLERAFIDCFELHGKEAAAMRGRYEVRIIDNNDECKVDPDLMVSSAVDEKVLAGLYSVQAGRLGHLANRTNKNE